MTERIIMPTCEFYCEMILGPDGADGENEIRKIHDEAVEMTISGRYKYVSISDFKNASGQTIGEFLIDKHIKFALALAKTEEVI